jgi:serine/threonine protein kinase
VGKTVQPSREAPSSLFAGKYRLVEPIGAGGVGTVWRAEHVLLHRAVAVKRIVLHRGDPMLVERFLREARIAAAIRHPNVVDVIDFGQTDDGQPFMVMELLEGESLLERVAPGRPPLATDQIVDIASQALLGLEAVHRVGIVHLDLKPGNIFLSDLEDGSVFARLLDFGISYSLDPNSVLRRGQFGTDARLVCGTPEYMSAEHAEGRADIDARSDVYAVGVVLYELLSGGQLPYTDENPGAILFKILKGVHTPLGELRPDLPALCEVVESALAREREARPRSARELRRRLLAAVGRGPEASGRQVREALPSDRPPALPAPEPAPASEPRTLVHPGTSSVNRWRRAAGASVVAASAGLLAAGDAAVPESDPPAAVGVAAEPGAPEAPRTPEALRREVAPEAAPSEPAPVEAPHAPPTGEAPADAGALGAAGEAPRLPAAPSPSPLRSMRRSPRRAAERPAEEVRPEVAPSEDAEPESPRWIVREPDF